MRPNHYVKAKWGVVAALLIAACVPFRTLSSPAWDVVVHQDDEHGAAGVLVRREYQNYSVEVLEHEEDQRTDSSGRVRFAPRYLSTPVGNRLWGMLHSAATGGVHASFGPHSFVFCIPDAELSAGADTWDGGKPGISAEFVMKQ